MLPPPFCYRSLHEYDECYLKSVATKCGRDTAQFLKGLADVNNSTLLELFSFDQNLQKVLPPECFKERVPSFQMKRDQLNSTQSSMALNGENVNSQSENYDFTDINKSWGGRNVAHKTYYCCFSGAIFAANFYISYAIFCYLFA